MSYEQLYTCFAPVAPSLQMPVAPQLITTRCLCSEEEVVGVLRPNGSYHLYTYSSLAGEMTPHICRCQSATTEEDLGPLYSEWSEKLNEMVFFLYNRVSGQVEQYVYSFDCDAFEEVDDTGLGYNQAKSCQTTTMAILTGPLGEHVTVFRDMYGNLKKEMSMNHHIRMLPPSRVKMLIRKEIQLEQMKQNQEIVEQDDAEEKEEEAQRVQATRRAARKEDDKLFWELLKLRLRDILLSRTVSSDSGSADFVKLSQDEEQTSSSNGSIEYIEPPFPGETPILRAAPRFLREQNSYAYGKMLEPIRVQRPQPAKARKEVDPASVQSDDASLYGHTDNLLSEIMKLLSPYDDDLYSAESSENTLSEFEAWSELEGRLDAASSIESIEHFDFPYPGETSIMRSVSQRCLEQAATSHLPPPTMLQQYPFSESEKSYRFSRVSQAKKLAPPTVFQPSDTTVERLTDESLESAHRYYSQLPEFVPLSDTPGSLFDEYLKLEPVQTVAFEPEDCLLDTEFASYLLPFVEEDVAPMSPTIQEQELAELEVFRKYILREYGLDKPKPPSHFGVHS